MKRLFASIAAVFCLAISIWAAPVSKERAASVAKDFLNSEAVDLVWENGALFAFNAPAGGWVIISADDAVTPIIAYSREGGFIAPEERQSNIFRWFNSASGSIMKAVDEKLEASETVKEQWARKYSVDRRRMAVPSTKTLATAPWDQDYPFNYKCPKMSGESDKAVTGCVATAMAIVMRYHKWPQYGKGTIPSYNIYKENGYTVWKKMPELNIDRFEYDWDSMPETRISSSCSSGVRDAVSALCYHCGLAVMMSYSYEGSAAYSDDAVPALSEYFSYSKKVMEYYSASFEHSEWMQMIKAEIDAGRPLLYGGSGDGGGHQFVCDGYDIGNDKIHINWGWSGDDNGFYTTSLYIDRDNDFGEDQSAIFGIEPDRSGSSSYGTIPIVIDDASGRYSNGTRGLAVKSGSIESKSFSVSAQDIQNCTASDYSGYFAIGLVDKKGIVKEIVSEPQEKDLPSWEYLTFSRIACSVKGDYELGDRIALCYKQGDGSWAPVSTNHEILNQNWDLAVFDCNFIRVEEKYSSGDIFYPEIIKGNRYIKSIAWYFDGRQDKNTGIKLTSGKHAVKAVITFTDGTKETVIQNISVN